MDLVLQSPGNAPLFLPLLPLQVYQQQLEKESLRARHQYDLLKRRESALVSRAREELAGIKERRRSLKNAGEAARPELGRRSREKQKMEIIAIFVSLNCPKLL